MPCPPGLGRFPPENLDRPDFGLTRSGGWLADRTMALTLAHAPMRRRWRRVRAGVSDAVNYRLGFVKDEETGTPKCGIDGKCPGAASRRLRQFSLARNCEGKYATVLQLDSFLRRLPPMEARPRRWGNCRHFPARRRSGALPRLKGSHGSTPPAMGELPALPCASAVGDASPAEGSHGSTPPQRWGNCRHFPARRRSGTLPRLKAPMEARPPQRWGNCRHFPARRRSGTLPRLKAPRGT